MDSLKRFGIQDDSKELIVINISENGARDNYNLGIIHGDEVKVDDDAFLQTVNYEIIKKVSNTRIPPISSFITNTSFRTIKSIHKILNY